VTKTIHVPVKAMGFGTMGKTEKAGFEIAFPIIRKEYGIERGGPVVGDEVEINIQIEADKKAAEDAKPPAPPAKS
jgi:polyisoprenoid-binding protein YceI